MAKNLYKIAIVGCGRIAGHHCSAIKSITGLEIVSVCDLLEDKAKDYGKEFKIPYFTDYHKMFRTMPEIDIVVVATPSGMHFEHVLEFIKKYNKHVIVEKPTFMRIDQLKKAYDEATKRGVHIFPVFQNRYNKAVQRLKKAILDKELGEIQIINVRVRWCRPQRYYDLAPWRGTFSHDGGALTNQGIHHIDLLRFLGGEVNKVSSVMRTLGSKIEVEDSVVANFTYKNNAIGSLEVTTAARPDDFEASLSLVGSEGLAQLGGIAVNQLQVFTPKPNECDVYSDDFLDLPDRGKVYGRGHKEMYNDIANFFFKGDLYPIHKVDCLNTIKLLHAFYKSDELGDWVKVDEGLQSTRLGRDNNELSLLYRSKNV